MSDVEKYLRMVAEMQKHCSKRHGIESFVLEHGQEMPFVTERPPDVRKGRMQRCFMNAARLAIGQPERFTYCEGFADAGTIPMYHAWVLDELGRAVETTWPDLADSYYGVAFNHGFHITQMLRCEMYCLIYQPADKFRLLRGEFPPSEFLHPKWAKKIIQKNDIQLETSLVDLTRQ